MNPLDSVTMPLGGHSLIEASAGTGKTYTLTTLFVRLLLERELELRQILVVTYTRAATAELRERTRDQIRAVLDALEGRTATDATVRAYARHRIALGTEETDRVRLRVALADFDQASITTIHGFAERVLRDHAFATGVPFDAEVLQQAMPVIEEVAEDYFQHALHDVPTIAIRHLQRRQIGPLALSSLFLSAWSPTTRVIPDAPVTGLDLSTARWSELRIDVSTLWQRHRDSLSSLLCESPALHRGRYKDVQILRDWVPALDSLGQDDDALPDWFKRLGTAAIERNTRKSFTPPAHPFFEACQALVDENDLLGAQLNTWTIAFEHKFLAYARDELQKRARQSAFFTYDDLLTNVHDALSGPGGASIATKLAATFPAALIDEFQDTDPLQHAIFERIYDERGTLVKIGDPKQAIYGFRGADVFAYLRAQEEPELRPYTLDTNWRSDPRLIQAVNTLFGRQSPPLWTDRIAFRPATPAPVSTNNRFEAPLELLWWEPASMNAPLIPRTRANQEIPHLIANEIAISIHDGVAPADIAVLCRTNKEAAAVQAALRGSNIPAALDGDVTVFESEAAESLEALLEAAANPGDARAIRRALSGAIFGHDLDALMAIRHEPATWERWQGLFQQWSALWYSHGLARFIDAFLEQSGVEAALVPRTGGERLWTDFDHLIEVTQQGTAGQRLHPNQLLTWFSRMRTGGSVRDDMSAEDTQQRIETDEPCVQVTTIHKSKGLEYPIVYCPFLWREAWLGKAQKRAVRFHDPEHDDRTTIDLGSDKQDEHLVLAKDEAFAESVRLLYVALTRAKHRCTVLWGPLKDWWKSPVAHYLHGTDPTRKSTKDPKQMLKDLQELEAASEGAIVTRPVSRQYPQPLVPARNDGLLRVREAARVFDVASRSSSFTSLTTQEDPPSLWSAPIEAATDTLGGFPAGRRSGSLLHDALESLDFPAATEDTVKLATDRELRRYGFDANWATPVTTGLVSALRTRLFDRGPRLSDLARSQRIAELEFTLATTSTGKVGPTELGDCLRQTSSLPPNYLARLVEMQSEPLSGFLRGFIDLTFEWEGRWYLVDYKSNKLAAYDQEEIANTMAEHHYYLQYHLYTVALHRHLSTRWKGYEYDKHMGGAAYLFLRGMTGDDGAGVFLDRPSRQAVEALDALLGGGKRT